MASPRFKSPCLIKARFGFQCSSCRLKYSRRHPDWYEDLKARGICVRCYARKSEFGVFCGGCRDKYRKLRIAKRRTDYRQIHCSLCRQAGHNAKTCRAERRAA